GSSVVLLYDVSSRQLLKTFRCQARFPLQGTGTRSLAFSPDGRWLAVGLRTGNIQIWDTSDTSPTQFVWLAHPAEVRGLAFSPDGKALASGSKDGDIKLWKSGSWKLRRARSFNEPIKEVTFTRDGRLLGCAAISWGKILNAETLADSKEVDLAAVGTPRW